MMTSKIFPQGEMVAVLAGVMTALLPRAAEACGGLFCSAAAPVNQTAERIIFSQEAETTTQIVEILYEGPSERFAWVLPVPGAPEVAVSSRQVFDRLQAATNPSYTLTSIIPDDCGIAFGSPGASGGTGGGLENSPSGPSVTVVDAGSVGPFDYETIAVEAADEDPADVAVRWLDANDYDVGALGPDVLRPYLENGLNLIAVRLQKGVDTGSIQPLSLTFQGRQPSIPIRPTAVAANDDMGVLVWILGKSRAVPVNYFGLELNEILIDWTNPGPTYDAVVSAAADEAGGQGFVTEFAGAAAGFAEQIAVGVEPLTESGYPSDSLEESLLYLTDRYGTFDGFVRALSQHAQFRDGLTAGDFTACPLCYFSPLTYPDGPEGVDYGTYDSETDPLNAVDLEALYRAVDEQVLLPIREAATLFAEQDYVTRLYTTMSASEMDLDPRFDFNPDLEEVSNVHVAEREFLDCGLSEWMVTLPDGRTVRSVDGAWPVSPSDPQGMPFNARVLTFTTSGPGVVATDNEDVIDEMMEDMGGRPMGMAGAGSGGGSSSGSGGTGSPGEGSGDGGSGPGAPATDGGSESGDAPAGGGLCSWSPGPGRSGAGAWIALGLALAGAVARRRRVFPEAS